MQENSGLEEKLDEIISNNEYEIHKLKEKENALLQYINFVSDHKFEEEKRIANIKYCETSLILHHYSKMVQELRDVLNKWNS